MAFFKANLDLAIPPDPALTDKIKIISLLIIDS